MTAFGVIGDSRLARAAKFALFLFGTGGCKETDQTGWSCAEAELQDPAYWEENYENSRYAFIGKVLELEQTCGRISRGKVPVVEVEVTEAFKGTSVGEHFSLQWWDGTDGCPPDVGVGEEWVIMTDDDEGHETLCDPGGLLADPNTDGFLEWLRSQSAT